MSDLEKKIRGFLALLVVAFLFLVVQKNVESLASLALGLREDPLWLVLSPLAFIIIFMIYYKAKSFEDRFFTGNKNFFLRTVFYYIMPIGLYLVFKDEFDFPITSLVIFLSIMVFLIMEKLYLWFKVGKITFIYHSKKQNK